MTHHAAAVTKRDGPRPFHAQCTCGTAGDFATEEEAQAYIQAHFAKLGGISTSELAEGVKQEQPQTLPHVGGVGTMPPSHAATPAVKHGPPPAPPAPDAPDQK